MRLLRSGSLALGVLLVGGASVAACSAKHDPAPGEILLAIDANLNVPADMDQLGVSVMAEDGTVSSTDEIYAMSPAGFVRFPATLAIVRGTAQPVDIKVAAFKGGEAFLLREVVTTLPADRTAILRVDLNWLDEGSTSGAVTKVQSLSTGMPCVSGQTSIDGTCQSFTLDSDTLPTYTNGALVPTSDAGGLCLDIPDCVVGQPGAVMPPTRVPQPKLGTVTDADGGVSPSCAIAPPAFGGDFNIGMVPGSGAAGWCNGSAGCALPLENESAPNWPTSPEDGMVHLPLGVCTSAKIAGLLLSQVTPGCPQYGAIEHPACQGYGVDGGDTPNGGGRRGGMTDDGSAGVYYAPISRSVGGTYTNVIGLAVDTTSSDDAGDVPVTFRTDGANGTAFATEPFLSSPFLDLGADSTVPVVPFAPSSSSFAVTSDRVAVASPLAVDVFFLDGGAAGPSHVNTSTGSSYPLQVGFDQNGLLVAAGFGRAVSWFLPDGGSGTNPSFVNDRATYLAPNEQDNSFVIASTGTDFDKLRSLKFEPTPTATTLPAPFVLAPPGSIEAVTVADATTVVWVDGSGQFYVASIDADAGAGTKLPVPLTALYDNGGASGALALTGGGGRIAWVDAATQHVWTMRVARGAAVNGPTDLSTRVPSEFAPAYINATTVALDPVANLLHWTQTDGNLYAQLLTRLPQ